MGCVQLGTGCLLATAASKHLSATELGLLALLEPILGPIWVWVLMGEHPGAATLVGGAIVLAAVFANEAFGAWRARGAGAPVAARPAAGTALYAMMRRPSTRAAPMKQTFLDFEQPIAELQAKIDELRYVHDDSAVDISDEIDAAARRRASSSRRTSTASSRRGRSRRSRATRSGRTRSTTSTASSPISTSCTATARSPTTRRSSAASRASTASRAWCIGHQKGRDTKEKIYRNFGMPRPEGYRKALRLMKLAEKFGLPLFTFVDTPGAYPGIGAEERGQSEAIGRNLYEMAGLRVPIIVTVIGEGGSGGALAIAIGDVTLMLQYSTYSVISPEGCASILWKIGGARARRPPRRSASPPRG